MTVWEVKLVPVDKPNADGRYTFVEAEYLQFSQQIGDEFVVSFSEVQPYYQWGGYPSAEFVIK